MVLEKDIWALFLVSGTDLQNPGNGLSDRGVFGSHKTTLGGALERAGWMGLVARKTKP